MASLSLKRRMQTVFSRPLDILKRNRFLLYIIVGVLNTIFGYSVFALLIFIGLHYTLAVFLATCLGVLFNFKTIGSIVFKNSNNRLIFRFVGVYVVQYFANIGLIKLFLLLSFNIYLAGAFSTFFCAVLSYLLNKHLVFMR